MVDGELLATGKVGAEVGVAEAAGAGPDLRAERAGRRGRRVAGGLGAIKRIVKVTGFVASAPDFTGQPQVMNGASELLLEVFGEAGRHARSAVGVAVLPLRHPGRGRAHRGGRDCPPAADRGMTDSRARPHPVPAASWASPPGTSSTAGPPRRRRGTRRRSCCCARGAGRHGGATCCAASRRWRSRRGDRVPRRLGGPAGRRRGGGLGRPGRGAVGPGLRRAARAGPGAGLRRRPGDVRGVGRPAGRGDSPTRSWPTPPARTGKRTGTRCSTGRCRWPSC